MTRALFIALALVSVGCSPLLGLVVRATRSTGGGDIRAGEERSGTTRGASDDWSLPCGSSSGPDAAYTFVPEQSGTYRAEVHGEYDCVVAVFDEDREPIGCNDDTGAVSHSQVDVRMEAGQRYTVVVDGFGGASGGYRVRLDAVQLDSGDEVPPSGRALTLDQPMSGDTRGQGDSRTPPCGSTAGSPDQTWAFVPPEDGTYQIDVESEFDGTLAIYPAGVATPLACNDDEGTTRASRIVTRLDGGARYDVVVDGYHGAAGAYRIRVSRGGSGQELTLGTPVRGDTRNQQDMRTPGCGSRPGSPDQTWRFTATRTGPVQFHVDAEYDSVLAIYEEGQSAPIECNDDYQGTRMSRLLTQLVAGHRYEVVVDGYSGSSGAYTLRASAIASSGGGAITVGQQVQGNTAAGRDRYTPTCGASSGSPDEIWTFVVPNTGMYRFHVDAQYDSLLALYVNGQPLACNDDFSGTRASRIEASLQAGQRVEVVVDGFSGRSGSYQLQITQLSSRPTYPPAPAAVENITALEGRCGSAPTLTAGRLTTRVTRSTAHARTTCAGGGGGGEALYTIQVQAATMLRVEAESDAGPVLELRAGCSRGHAVVACDGSTPQASLSARLEPGRAYTLVVDSRAAADVEVTLDVQLTPSP